MDVSTQEGRTARLAAILRAALPPVRGTDLSEEGLLDMVEASMASAQAWVLDCTDHDRDEGRLAKVIGSYVGTRMVMAMAEPALPDLRAACDQVFDAVRADVETTRSARAGGKQ